MCGLYVNQCILHLAWITNPIYVFHYMIPLFPTGCQVSEKTQVLVKSGSSLWSGHIWARFGVSLKEIQKLTGVTWLAQYLPEVSWLSQCLLWHHMTITVFALASHDYQCFPWNSPHTLRSHTSTAPPYLLIQWNITQGIYTCMQRPC